jgi:4-azaleucine resistance transporter AzlC
MSTLEARCYVRPVSDDAHEGQLRDGVRAGLPIALGPLLFGISFGLLAKGAGMGSAASIVFSATTFAGSAQFAAVSVLGAGGSVIAAVVAAVFLNARYAPMSFAAAGVFRGRWWRRLLEAQLLVDESWALAGRGGRFRREVLIGAGLLMYLLWIFGTAVGTFVGDRLGKPSDYGLDAAFAALFLGLAAPTLRGRRARVAAAVGGLIVVVLLPFAPAGVPLVAASAACLLGLRR